MSNCLDPQPPSQQEIVQNDDCALAVRLETNDLQRPFFDITGVSEIVAILPISASPGYLEKKLSLTQINIISAPAGSFEIMLTPADTAQLTVGIGNIEVRITLNSKVTTVQLMSSINVLASLYPTAP